MRERPGAGESGGASPPVLPRLVVPGYLLGLLVIVGYAVPAGWRDGTSQAAVGIASAAAAYLAGSFLGFLFGIPRSAGDGAERPAGEQSGYRANTNLEQISDWLTKILVGVGLIQLTSIGSGGSRLVRYVAAGLGDRPGAGPLALAVLTGYSLGGFLVGYLYTRTALPRAFRQADLSALEDRVKQAEEVSRHAVATSEQVQRDVREQAERDAKLLALVEQHFDAGDGSGTTVTPEELRTAAAGASATARLTAFAGAQRLRKMTWREDKALMARSVDVFRALIDTENNDASDTHWTHGELGFALKDLPSPDWAAAEAELTRAIELRGPWRQNGWLFYELNRAQCRIMRDPAHLAGKPSPPHVRAAVLADVFAAAHNASALRIMRGDPTFVRWFERNEVSADALPEAAGQHPG